jgi:putative ABC transport system permease protein
MSLALATLIYEWRRYLAAVIALALSGTMVLVLLGLFTGIVHSILATTERTPADLIIMPPKVQTFVNSNVTLPDRIRPEIFLNPHVIEVRSSEGNGAQWVNEPKPGVKQVQKFVQVFAVDPIPGAVSMPRDFPESVRQALVEPDAFVIDQSDVAPLGVNVGDAALINGHTVHLRAVLHGYQDINQPTVIVSRDTADMLGAGSQTGDSGALLVRIDHPALVDQVTAELNAVSHGAYHAWTMAQFNQANEKAIMSEQIIGILLAFLTFMAALIGVGITSQTLRGAILSNIREFASLRALGISMGSLRLIVMELSAWAGVAGVTAAAILTLAASAGAASMGLPLTIRAQPALMVAAMLMTIAIVSGAMAMGVLKQSQPADLLR